MDDAGGAESEPPVQPLGGAVGVGEEERQVLARPRARRVPRRRRRGRDRARAASCRRTRSRRRARSRAGCTSRPARPRRACRTRARPPRGHGPAPSASIAVATASVLQGSPRSHSSRSGQTSSGATSSTGAATSGGSRRSAITRWRLTRQPSAENSGTSAAPIGSCMTSTNGRSGKRSSAAVVRSPTAGASVRVSTRTRFASRTSGMSEPVDGRAVGEALRPFRDRILDRAQVRDDAVEVSRRRPRRRRRAGSRSGPPRS